MTARAARSSREGNEGDGEERRGEDVQTESGSAWAENRAPGSLVDILPLRSRLRHRHTDVVAPRARAHGKHNVPRQRKQILRNRAAHCLGGSSATGSRLGSLTPSRRHGEVTLDLTTRGVSIAFPNRHSPPISSRDFVSHRQFVYVYVCARTDRYRSDLPAEAVFPRFRF